MMKLKMRFDIEVGFGSKIPLWLFPDFHIISIIKVDVPNLGAFRGIKSVFCVPLVYFC